MKPDLFTRVGLVIVIILLLSNLIFRLETTSRAAGPVQYNVVSLPRFRATQQELQSMLDQQGSQGWELILRYENERGDFLILKK